MNNSPRIKSEEVTEIDEEVLLIYLGPPQPLQESIAAYTRLIYFIEALSLVVKMMIDGEND